MAAASLWSHAQGNVATFQLTRKYIAAQMARAKREPSLHRLRTDRDLGQTPLPAPLHCSICIWLASSWPRASRILDMVGRSSGYSLASRRRARGLRCWRTWAKSFRLRAVTVSTPVRFTLCRHHLTASAALLGGLGSGCPMNWAFGRSIIAGVKVKGTAKAEFIHSLSPRCHPAKADSAL